MIKITVDIARGITEVFVVKRSSDGYLVSLTEDLTGVFYVTDDNVIPL
jgi:hypothetical protein